ncbi:hypothetical protein G6F31_021693 [Rhizopus arrhizus]|nr:hypothetical protein G6F31_021693 [Rhizopus arrhizus]
MQHEVQPAPCLRDAIEHGFQFAFVQQVHGPPQRAVHLPRQRLHVRQGVVVEVGHGQFSAHGAKGLGASPGDGIRVGDAGDEPALAGQRKVRAHR